MSAPDRRALLLRDPPEEGLMSMERYADALTAALRSHTAWKVHDLRPHVSGRRGAGYPRDHVTRFVKYPIVAAKRRADVFHVVDQGYAHAAALLPNDRTIVTAHDLMLLRSEQGVTGFTGTLPSRLRFRWTVSHLKHFAHVICVSRTTQEDVIDLAGVSPHRTSVVPLGVDQSFRVLPEAETAEARRLVAAADVRVLLHVGAPVPYKNIPAILRVVRRLLDRGIKVRLLRVGDRLTGEDARLVRELRLDDSVRELGRVPEKELVALYNLSDVVIQPSFWEGFGWPVLEAMACGTPVVCSTAPALKEAVADCALLADPGDIDHLASKVEDVLSNVGLSMELRAKGVARARQFNWSQIAERIAGIYERTRFIARP